MIKKIQILLMFCASITGIKAQDGGTSSNVAKTIDFYPKSPEAAALSQYVDIPAGNFTGVADFSIPIYTIDFDGQQIPISLRYTTTGIKVDQIATRVGLGWTIDTGPSLSVQAIGNLDVAERPDFGMFYPNLATYQQHPDYLLAKNAASIGLNPFDPEPDIFTYRLLNNNGRYILDRNGVVGTPIPYNQVKITGSNYRGQMEIIDEQGNKHNFFSSIGAKNHNSCMTPGEFTYDSPTYLINTIESPKKRIVKYSYTSAYNVYARYITSVQTTVVKSYYAGAGIIPPNCTECYPSARTKCTNYAELTEPVLSQIEFDGGKVLFTYSNNTTEQRLDLRGDSTRGDVYLKNIKVVNTKGETIKDFSLEYDYFFSTGSLPSSSELGNISGIYAIGMNYRLKLKKVTDNLTNGKYILDYYETANDGKTLPIRTSNDQDFWGVYNGAGNGIKAIASWETPYYSSGNKYLQAIKNPNLVYGVLGNLQKISYPTGGYTSIEYEADDFGPSDMFYTNGYTKTGTMVSLH